VGAFPDSPGTVAELVRAGSSRDWQEAERWLAGFVLLAAKDREALRAGLSGSVDRIHELYRSEDWYAPYDWFTAIAAELLSPGADPGPALREDQEAYPVWALGSGTAGPGEAGGWEMFLGDFLAGVRHHVIRVLAGGDEGGGATGWEEPRGTARELRPDRLPRESDISRPHRFVLRRCAEVLAALRAGTLPPAHGVDLGEAAARGGRA